MTQRVFPPISVGRQSITVLGRTYTATPGTVLDVPDQDAAAMAAGAGVGNGWPRLMPSGTTAQRPGQGIAPNGNGVVATGGAYPGLLFLDTTLGLVVAFDGQTWRNPVTGAAV